MGNKPAGNDRKRRIDDIKTQQKKSERRVTYVFVGVAVLLAAGLVAGAVLAGGGKAGKAIEGIGVAKTAAGCGEVTQSGQDASAQHVGPGASSEELEGITTVSYAMTPPTAGDHYLQTAPPNKQFYDRDDFIQPERLVHNLEHGYVVVWYDSGISDDDLDTLREISRNIDDAGARYGPKFIVAPYTRGDFEGDANVGLTAWQFSQLCDGVSGAAIKEFVDDYRGPNGSKSIAPEKAVG